MRKLIVPVAAVLITAAVCAGVTVAQAAPARSHGCGHTTLYHATGTISLRTFLRRHQVHGGLPGVLATSYTCGGGWTPDWAAYLRKVNRLGTRAPLLPGMRIWYVGPGPRP